MEARTGAGTGTILERRVGKEERAWEAKLLYDVVIGVRVGRRQRGGDANE